MKCVILGMEECCHAGVGEREEWKCAVMLGMDEEEQGKYAVILGMEKQRYGIML